MYLLKCKLCTSCTNHFPCSARNLTLPEHAQTWIHNRVTQMCEAVQTETATCPLRSCEALASTAYHNDGHLMLAACQDKHLECTVALREWGRLKWSNRLVPKRNCKVKSNNLQNGSLEYAPTLENTPHAICTPLFQGFLYLYSRKH